MLPRIGAAVVVLWKGFPELQQSRIIQQAVSTRDRIQTVQLNEEMLLSFESITRSRRDAMLAGKTSV
jgi:hypothetical protein